ncbi:DUF6541 family protein [Microbacterium sp.]|uniref:DUF6541 family protein n=1 Tax=Microbacterium sp. TaxID=51671 RepID=UPI003341BCDD
MSEWIGQAPALLVAFALLIVPGLPMAVLLRFRGLLLPVAAITGSMASIVGASILAPILGLRWSIWPVLGVAAAITLIAAVLRFLSRGRTEIVHAGESGRSWIAVAVSIVGWMVILVLGIMGPDHPSQLFDGLFHLNAVEFIQQTGDASPFHMTMVLPGTETSFYPTGWHAAVSLLLPFSASIVTATNVMTVAVISLLWPLGIAALSAALFPQNRAVAFWTPLAAFGFSVFPLGFLNWGVLYPNLLGMLQAPMLIALVLIACRRGLVLPQRIGAVLLVLASAGAVAISHPSALLGVVALLVPFAAWWTLKGWRAAGRSARIALVAVALVVLVALAAVWTVANVTTNEWLPGATLAQAIGETAFLSPVGRATGLLVGPLAVVGIWATVRERRWWILWSHGVAILLFLVSTWLPVLSLRSAIVGIWYDDTTRVAAFLSMFGLPLAGYGAAIVAEWVRDRWQHGNRLGTGAFVLCAVLLAATHLFALQGDLRFMRGVSFRFDQESQGLSSDEAKLFAKADAFLDDKSLVIGDPLTGAGLLYAYTGHDVVFPHVTGDYGPDAALLARSLRTGEADVCAAIDRLGVTNVLDFGDRELFENYYTTFDGLHDLKDVPILTLEARVGDAALYSVTGCR